MPYISQYKIFYFDLQNSLSNIVIDIIQKINNINFTTKDLYNSYRYLTYENLISNKSLYKVAYDIDIDYTEYFLYIITDESDDFIKSLLLLNSKIIIIYYFYLSYNDIFKKGLYFTIYYKQFIKKYDCINDLLQMNINNKTSIFISKILKKLQNYKEINYESLLYQNDQQVLIQNINTKFYEDFYTPNIINKYIYKNNSIHFITVCDNPILIDFLLLSAKFNKIHINCIIIEKWSGFECKIKGILEFIKKNNYDNDIICFIDAYDVLFNDTSENIIRKFYDFSCNIVFSSEINCYPYINKETYEKSSHFSNDSPFKYLNSGGFIGYKKNIMEMLLWKNFDEIKSICKNGGDQNYFTKYYLEFRNSSNIKLDFYQKIFQSMCSINYNKIFNCKKGKIFNNLYNHYPSILHFNGFEDMSIKKIKHLNTLELIHVLKSFYDLIIISYKSNKNIAIPFEYPYEILFPL
jgi:hypothetical protein